MKVKYQITMEVEIEMDNLNDKVTNSWTRRNLAIIAEAGFQKNEIMVSKVQVSRIEATGVKPEDVRQEIKMAAIKNSVQIKDGGWKVVWLDPDRNEHITQCPFAKSKRQAEQDTLEAANEYLNPKPIRSRKVSMISTIIDEANEY